MKKPAGLKLLFKSFVLTLFLFLAWLLDFSSWFLILAFIFFISFYLFSGQPLKKIRFSFWPLIFLALTILALPSTFLPFADRGILLIDRLASYPPTSGVKNFFEFQNNWLIPVGLKLFLLFIFFILFFLFLKSVAGNFNFLIYSAGQFVLLILTALLWFYLISFAVSNFVLFFLSFLLFLAIFLIFYEAFLNAGGFNKWRLGIAALAIGFVSLELAWFLTLLPLSFFNAAGLLVLILFLLREGFIAYFKNKFRLKFAVFLLTFFIIFILLIFFTSQWSV